ncbi:hypothetical protein ACP4OV_018050 [Aristida adscensionis]
MQGTPQRRPAPPQDATTMGGGGGIAADALAEILLRVPPCPRRRLRLVCRHWRDVIDDRTPAARRAATKVLAVTVRRRGGAAARAFVLDELREGARPRELLDGVGVDVSMVGTCNGLLCLRRGDGDLAVVNPATRETLPVPPPRMAHGGRKLPLEVDATSSTGLRKPDEGLRGFDKFLNTMHVFTLGDESWREVRTPGSSCCLKMGLVSINGAMYWATRDGKEVMLFDLKDEHVTFVKKLPAPMSAYRSPTCRLTEIGGRLGYIIAKTSCTEVWVLEGGGTERTWILRHTVEMTGLSSDRAITSPLVVHGEHLLTVASMQLDHTGQWRTIVYAHRPEKEGTGQFAAARIDDGEPGTVVGELDYHGTGVNFFAYVETMEPLAIYGGSCDGPFGTNEWKWKFDWEEGRWKLIETNSLWCDINNIFFW